jgi:6-phosphogluconolactonase
MPRSLQPIPYRTLTCLVICSLASGLHAAERLVFVSAFAGGDQGCIQAYSFNSEDGSLTPTTLTKGVEFPFFLALSPNHHFLYSTHAPGEFGGQSDEFVAAYEIVGGTGELKLLNRQSTRGSSSCYVEVDATGKSLVVANYSTGSVASLPIHADGSLGEIVTFVQQEGHSINPKRQEGPHTHCAVISPDNRFLYAADLGLDKVLCYTLDAPAARLCPNTQPFVRTIPGAGPRHLRFHPDGKHLYAINELANSLTLFDYDPTSGILLERQTIATLPPDFQGESYCADVKVTPDGRFVYGTNRGHDSLAIFRTADDSTLSLVSITPSGGQQPQNLAITPDGKWLLCANMGGNVVVFQIHPQSGELTPAGTPVALPSPSCIMIR